jgi:hypothetical protein
MGVTKGMIKPGPGGTGREELSLSTESSSLISQSEGRELIPPIRNVRDLSDVAA